MTFLLLAGLNLDWWEVIWLIFSVEMAFVLLAGLNPVKVIVKLGHRILVEMAFPLLAGLASQK